LVPQQASRAAGGSNVQALPHWTVLLGAQVTTGGVVSMIVTVWLHRGEAFPQQSVACHCRVAIVRHGDKEVFVVVPMIVTVMFVPQQASKTAGGSKLHGSPHSIVLFGAQVNAGGVVSMMVTTSVHAAVLVQQSCACQVIVSL